MEGTLLDGTNFKLRFSYGTDQTGRKITTCVMQDADGIALGTGTAACALGDQFVKAEGRKLALTRAIRRHSRANRAIIWAAYHLRAGGAG